MAGKKKSFKDLEAEAAKILTKYVGDAPLSEQEPEILINGFTKVIEFWKRIAKAHVK
jgi:hypothetical protein